jgi:hypothetical protein
MTLANTTGGQPNNFLNWLSQGSPPPSTTTSSATQQTMPQWYQDFTQGLAAQGANIAGQQYPAYPGQMLADFSPMQQMAFQNIGENQGAWQPTIAGAANNFGTVSPLAQNQLNLANQYGGAAAGVTSGGYLPGYQQMGNYQSPYTQSVLNSIAQLGNNNFWQNIAPGIQSSFIGTGGFGSQANQNALSLAAVQNNQNIMAQQAAAGESGFFNSANLGNQAAGQQQTQEQLAQTGALGAGNLAAYGGASTGNVLNQTGAGLGSLGQVQQNLLSNDASQLLNAGGMQQNLQQQGYNTGYNQFMNQALWPQQQLGWLSNIVRGYQMPMGTSTASSSPQTNNMTSGSSSPLSAMGTMLGANQLGQTQPGTVGP